MPTLLEDLRYALRLFRKAPGFTAVAVLAVALGIGANTAIFSVIDAILLRPLPYKDPGRLVKIWTRFEGIGLPNNRNWVSAPEFMDFRALGKSFSHIAAISGDSANVSSGGVPERVEAAVVSSGFFPLLGVEAQLGRVFLPEEDHPGRDNVVLLGDGLWRRRFGADPKVVGQKLTISGRSFLLVGILPPGFRYPADADIWVPLAFSNDDLGPGRRGNHGLEVLARIKPDLSLAQAHADMDAVARRMEESHPEYPYRRYGFGLIVTPLLEEMVGDTKTALWILMGAVGFVLLIACANVANLLVARASTRGREIAIRTAVGAGRWRIVRQLLTESVILGLGGGAAGLLLAYWGLHVLGIIGAASFPRVADARLDGFVLAFTMLISIGTGLLFGLAPAFQISHVTHEALKEGGRGTTAGRVSEGLRRTLVVAEIALSLVLLAGSGLLLKSFARLMQVDPGFRPEGVLTMRFSLPDAKYPKEAQVRAFYGEVADRVSKLPGVEAAGLVSALPLSGNGGSGTTTVDSRAVSGPDASPEADWRPATPGYFKAMGISLVSGRYFDERDTETSAPVAIVDESLARTYWPNEDAVGKRLKRGDAGSTNSWMTIVGVVRHVRYRTLEAQSRVALYWPHAQNPYSSMSLALRTSSPEPRALAATVQREILAIDPDQPVYKVRTMQELMADAVARRRLAMLLLALFAVVALVLAAVGIYGVMSFSVTQRAQEMGIRLALGASRASVFRLVLGQSLSLTLAGGALGLAGSLVMAGLISSLLFNVKPRDPLTFSLVAMLLTLVALIASYLPARKATKVDPVVSLRYE
ncbi:MAG TPA: ABC transporter permease [Bryobacteraceae bacterium]|nr:ABC transporter permease [Bryobacteraceae bacterium]